MRREKITFFKIFITLVFLISLPLVIILTNSPGKVQDIRSKATITPLTSGKILFVPFSFSKDKDDDILDFKDKPQIRNGFVPSVSSNGPQFAATVLKQNGQIIYSQKFSLPQLVAIDNIDKSNGKEKAELKKVTSNSLGFNLPYDLNAGFLQIKSPKGEVIKSISLKNINSFNNIMNLKEIHGGDFDNIKSSLLNYPNLNKVFAANGTFNIAIIGDNYNGDNTHFQNDVNDIAAGLLSVEPFKTYKSNITFYPQLSTAQICSFTTSLTCNDTLSLQQASSTPYDKIYVLYNGPYAGFAYLGSNLSYGTSATGMATGVKQALFIHEMAGHALGGLMDEYSYGTTGASYAPNCTDFPSCPSWNSITGLGCFLTCGFTNLYRPTDNGSVMNTALLNGTLNFDAFSTQIVNGKLATFLGASPPTASLAPSTPTPTITPSLTPSITPSLTPSATPSPTEILVSITPSPSMIPSPTPIGFIPSVTPYLSPTPTSTPSLTPTSTPTATPSSTPTPSQIPGCTFPNFCTQAKYCETENILPISCNSNSQVCCKFQEQSEQPPLNPQSVENTPTPIQRFESLPTLTPAVSRTPTPTAIHTTPAITIIPSFTPTPTVTRNVYPTFTTPPSLSPTLTTEIFSTPTIILLSPTKSFEENYIIYPTPTIYSPENITFERISPTAQPKVGFWNILSTPSNFINNLVKNFFSIFSRK